MSCPTNHIGFCDRGGLSFLFFGWFQCTVLDNVPEIIIP